MPDQLLADVEQLSVRTGKNRSEVICEIYAFARNLVSPVISDFVRPGTPVDLEDALKKQEDRTETLKERYFTAQYLDYKRLMIAKEEVPWDLWATLRAKHHGIKEMDAVTLKAEMERRHAEETRAKEQK